MVDGVIIMFTDRVELFVKGSKSFYYEESQRLFVVVSKTGKDIAIPDRNVLFIGLATISDEQSRTKRFEFI